MTDGSKDHEPTTKKPLARRHSSMRPFGDDDVETHWMKECSGAFRGIAAATRKLALASRKAVVAKTTVAQKAKTTARAMGDNRPLAFASEGAVAGEPILPKVVYYGAWTLSGLAISADIYNKYDDAPVDKKWQSVAYWTAFHIPASLVVPALIIHQVVHRIQQLVESPTSLAKAWPPRAKAVAPVAAALISIVPVGPAVDFVAEAVMEPTLGAYLGLTFYHSHHDDRKEDAKPKQE